MVFAGIKGRLQTSKYEDEINIMHYSVDVIAERVTFLSTNKKHELEENDRGKTKKADE